MTGLVGHLGHCRCEAAAWAASRNIGDRHHPEGMSGPHRHDQQFPEAASSICLPASTTSTTLGSTSHAHGYGAGLESVGPGGRKQSSAGSRRIRIGEVDLSILLVRTRPAPTG